MKIISFPNKSLYRTTAQEHFKPENALKFDKKEQKSLMTSSVPTGDKEKIAVPLSEVRDSYKGQSVDHIKPNRYPDYINYGIIDTLKTDRRKPPPYQTTNQVIAENVPRNNYTSNT